MKFEKVNGMSFARYIAANLLSNSNYRGNQYYEKEDEYTEIIERLLQHDAKEVPDSDSYNV